jgi:NTE family protein
MLEDGRPVWVLGGGGVAGIAWEVGILAGLAEAGVAVRQDAVLIGTSAGAVVCAQVASGAPLPELYERQRAGVPYEHSTELGLSDLLRLARAQMFARSPEQAARRIGRLALASDAGPPDRLHRVVEARLPDHDWKDVDLRIVVVDAESGVARVITRKDGVSLVDAVTASCAVPLASPPVTIDGHRYMDGGMRSTLNLDLAPGTGPVIALAPSTAAIGLWARIPKQRAALGKDRRVELVLRDAASKRVQGRSVMNKAIVPALVAAAREQGRREAPRVAAALATTNDG